MHDVLLAHKNVRMKLTRMRIVVYGYDYCPYTRSAAELAGVPIIAASDILNSDPNDAVLSGLLREVKAANHRTIPMCFDMDKRTSRFIGGLDKLRPYMEKKEKERRLRSNAKKSAKPPRAR